MTLALAPLRPTNASLLESFAEDATLRGLTKETLRAYLSYAGILAAFLASRGKGFLDVDADLSKDILRYVLSRDVKAKTVRAYFSALSAVCDFLQYEGLLPANPVPPFRKRYLRDYKKRRGEDDGVRRLLSVEEVRLMIGSTLDPRDRAMLTVLAKTGVRREELIAMDVELTSILFAIVAIVIGEAIRSWLMGQAGPNLGSILEGTVGAPISSFMLKTLSVTVASYMLQVAIVKKFDLLKVTLTAWGWAFSLIGLGLALYFAAFPPPSELDDWVAAAYGVMALAGVLLAVQALLGGGTVLMLILRVVGLLIGISGVTLAVARLYF